MRLTPSQADTDAATAQWISTVQAVCPEPVLGACRFAPPRNEVAGRAAALGGSLGAGWIGRRLVKTVEAAGNRDRAGGLPSSFVLVVAPKTVRAYESHVSRSGSAIGPEVANWDRSALQVLSVDRGGLKTTVQLSLPNGDEIACSAGTHDYTDRFIALLETGVTPSAPAIA
jgi:hypothetical protein